MAVLAGLVLMTCALLVAAGRVVEHDHELTELWPLSGPVYLAGALLATLALSRFRLAPVPRRLPFVVLFHLAGVALVAFLAKADGGSDGGGRRGSRLDSALDRAVPTRRLTWQPPEPGDPRTHSLACALLEGQQLAPLFGGGEVSAPEPTGHWVLRARSMCTCSPVSGKGFLQLAVSQVDPRRRGRVLARVRGERLVGLGDEAVVDRHGGLFVAQGRWLVVLQLLGRPLDPAARAALIDIGREAAARLPAEVDQADATDRDLAGDAWGAVSRILQA